MIIEGCRVVSPSTDSWVGLIPRSFSKFGLNVRNLLNTELPFTPSEYHSFEIYLVSPETKKEWWKTPSEVYRIFPFKMVDFTKLPLMNAIGFRKPTQVGTNPVVAPTTQLTDTEIMQRWAADALNLPSVVSNSTINDEITSFRRLCCVRTYEYYFSRLVELITKLTEEKENVQTLIDTISPGLEYDTLTFSSAIASYLGISPQSTLLEVYDAWLLKAEEEREFAYDRIQSLVSEQSNNFVFAPKDTRFLQHLASLPTTPANNLYRIDAPSQETFRPLPGLMIYFRLVGGNIGQTNRFGNLITIHNRFFDPGWDLYAGEAVGWQPYQHSANAEPSTSLLTLNRSAEQWAPPISVIPFDDQDHKGTAASYAYDSLGVTFKDVAYPTRSIPKLAAEYLQYSFTSKTLATDIHQATFTPNPILAYPNYRGKQEKLVTAPIKYSSWFSFYDAVHQYRRLAIVRNINDLTLGSIYRLNYSNPNNLYQVRGWQSFDENDELITTHWYASGTFWLPLTTQPFLIDPFLERIHNPLPTDNLQVDGNILTLQTGGWEGLRRSGDFPDYTYTPETFYTEKIVAELSDTAFSVKTYIADITTVPISPDVVTSFEWDFSSHTSYMIYKF